jgi:aminoglycoside phosphotransferase (APT) family kinase protein
MNSKSPIVRAGWSALDIDDVRARATHRAREMRPDARVDGFRRLPGGLSGITLATDLHDGETELPLVLKVAPPGLAPVLNRDVLRQARLLRALAGLDGFPVPAVVFEDAGDPPLFAMERVPGQAYEPGLDIADDAPSAELVRSRMLTAARTLAALHAVTPTSRGLGAEAPVSPSDELDRWRKLGATVDPSIGPGREEIAERLASGIPPSLAAVIQHGDFRLQNMLFVDDHLAGIIDWEIWSVGDPRSDLAWLLMHLNPAHVFDEERPARDRAAASGLPTSDALVSAYASERRARGADAATVAEATSGLGWFLGLAYFKTASTLAAIVKRDRRQPERDPRLVTAERHLNDVLAAANAALADRP